MILILKKLWKDLKEPMSEEITKRFVRGEKARTGEGSGLGLAIAKTYTESCGGQFHIVIEDDCFIAVICLPSVTS